MWKIKNKNVAASSVTECVQDTEYFMLPEERVCVLRIWQQLKEPRRSEPTSQRRPGIDQSIIPTYSSNKHTANIYKKITRDQKFNLVDIQMVEFEMLGKFYLHLIYTQQIGPRI